MMDFSEKDQLLEETVQKAESVGVTWMFEGIYGLRYNGASSQKSNDKPPSNRLVQLRAFLEYLELTLKL